MDGARTAAADDLDLLESSAFEIAGMIRRREVSALEVVEAHVARIERVNPLVNAVVNERFDAARAEAREVDDAIARGDGTPPLAGVPCTIKEFFGVAGMPQTGGMMRHKGRVAERDAPVVRRVRDAGAIVLGTTNVPEGGIWVETYNPVYGRTNNPWDVARTPGGSSGGEAAIIAAGGSPFGIGSDIGGSIRLPSALCGIAGHKPTGRLVPNTGQYPSPEGGASAFLTAGPMARRASDLMPLLRIIAGPDAGDPICVPMELGDPAKVDLRGLTVVPLETNGRSDVSRVMRREVRRAARALEERGAIVKEMDFPRIRRPVEIWAAMLEAETNVHYDEIVGGERGVPLYELFLYAMGRSQHSLPPIVVSILDKIVSRLPIDRSGFVRDGLALRDEIEAALGERGVLLHPPYTRPAPKHHHAWKEPFAPAVTAIFNVLELPGTVVPTGFDPIGLPVGVQIVAPRGKDHVSIAAALALEEHFGGWVMATPHASR